MRILFGVIWAINAFLKWLPGYRHTYIDASNRPHGQPSWLHGWFHFWINLQSGAPTLFATLTGLTETTLALELLLSVARRVGYSLGVGYMLMVWAVGEGFGGPYIAGSTDVGTGIVYTMLFLTLPAFAPPARRDVSASTGSWSGAGHGGATSPSRTPSIASTARPWWSPW